MKLGKPIKLQKSQRLIELEKSFNSGNKKYRVEDAETGNWCLGNFSTIEECIDLINNDPDTDEIPLSIIATEEDRTIYNSRVGYIK